MLAYNTSEYSIIKRTLFFINKKFKADVSMETQKCKELVPHTVTTVEEIHKLQKKLRQNLIFFNRRIKRFVNKKRVQELTLKKKNKVYLL